MHYRMFGGWFCFGFPFTKRTQAHYVITLTLHSTKESQETKCCGLISRNQFVCLEGGLLFYLKSQILTIEQISLYFG